MASGNATPSPEVVTQSSGVAAQVAPAGSGQGQSTQAAQDESNPQLRGVLYGVLTDKPPNGHLTTTEKMGLAASVQVASGMMMGFVSVFIGLLITWFGIHASFEFGGKVGDKGEASLKSASPGLLFFLGGIILIGVSLYKPLRYTDSGGEYVVPLDPKTFPSTSKSER